MNKKASSILMMVFEILAVVLIISIVLGVARGYASSDTVLKVNTAQDLALMADALLALPGDAQVIYTQNVSAYSILLDSGKIIVMQVGEPREMQIERTFNLPTGYSASGVVEQQETVCLQKKNKEIRIMGCTNEQK